MGFLMTKPKGHTDVLFVNFRLYNVKFQLLNYSSIHIASAFNKVSMGDNLCILLQCFTNSLYVLDKLLISQAQYSILGLSITHGCIILLQ